MAFKWYGEVYMDAVFHAYQKKYGGGYADFDDALWNEFGLSTMYLDLKSDYFRLENFIKVFDLNLDEIKAEIAANGYEYIED